QQSQPRDEEDQYATVPFDMAKYVFSEGAESILLGAASRRLPKLVLSSSAVIVEMAEQGEPTSDPRWIGDFLRREVSAHPEAYRRLVDGYPKLAPKGQRSAGRAPAVTKMMRGLAFTLDLAQGIATKTTGNSRICGRHLLAALLIEAPKPYVIGAQRQLDKIGIDVPLLRECLYDWVKGYEDT